MKIRVRYLKELINTLTEEAVQPAKIKSQGLALLRHRHEDMSAYVLYNPAVAYDVFTSGKKDEDGDPQIPKDVVTSGKFIVGVIATHQPSHPSNGAKEIKMTAAVKGYGPYLYDVVMGMEGGLIPDRNSVSDKAKKVWGKYQSRSDVKHQELDDVENPKTPDKADDSKVYPGGEKNPLNYSYTISRTPEAGELMARHEDLVDAVEKNSSYDRHAIDLAIVFAANDYFLNRYRDNFGGSF
jgi:hypothetical protein